MHVVWRSGSSYGDIPLAGIDPAGVIAPHVPPEHLIVPQSIVSQSIVPQSVVPRCRSSVDGPLLPTRVTRQGFTTQAIPAGFGVGIPGYTFPASAPGMATAGISAVDPCALRCPALRTAAPGAIDGDVRIELVGLAGTAGNIAAQRLGFPGLLFRFLAQPGRIDLRLLGIGTCPNGLGFPFPGIDFHVFGFAPDFSGLFPVFPVALFLHCPPAPPANESLGVPSAEVVR